MLTHDDYYLQAELAYRRERLTAQRRTPRPGRPRRWSRHGGRPVATAAVSAAG